MSDKRLTTEELEELRHYWRLGIAPVGAALRDVISLLAHIGAQDAEIERLQAAVEHLQTCHGYIQTNDAFRNPRCRDQAHKP